MRLGEGDGEFVEATEGDCVSDGVGEDEAVTVCDVEPACVGVAVGVSPVVTVGVTVALGVDAAELLWVADPACVRLGVGVGDPVGVRDLLGVSACDAVGDCVPLGVVVAVRLVLGAAIAVADCDWVIVIDRVAVWVEFAARSTDEVGDSDAVCVVVGVGSGERVVDCV